MGYLARRLVCGLVAAVLTVGCDAENAQVSLPEAQAAVRVLERARPNSREYFDALLRLAHMEYQTMSNESAVAHYKLVYEQNLAKNWLNVKAEIELITGLVGALNRQARNAEAVPYKRRELMILEGAGLQNDPQYVNALGYLSRLLGDSNQYADAERYSTRALQAGRLIAAKDPATYRAALWQHISVLQNMGRLSELPTYQQELVAALRPPNIATAQAVEITTYVFELGAAGRGGEAARFFEEALNLKRTQKDVAGVVWLLDWAANMRMGLSLETLERHSRELVELLESVIPKDHHSISRAYFGLGQAQLQQGHLSAALVSFDRCMELSRNAYPEPPTAVLRGKAQALFGLHRAEEALSVKQQMVDGLRRQNGPRHFETIGATAELATNYTFYKQFEKGLALGREAVDAVDALYEEQRYADTADLRRMFTRFDGVYRSYATLLLLNGRHSDAFYFIEGAKARSATFLAVEAMPAREGGPSPEQRAKLRELRSKIAGADAAIAAVSAGDQKAAAIEARAAITQDIRSTLQAVSGAPQPLPSLMKTTVAAGDSAFLGKDTLYMSIHAVNDEAYAVFVLDSEGVVTTHPVRPVRNLAATAEVFAALPRALNGADILDWEDKPLRISKVEDRGMSYWQLEQDTSGCHFGLQLIPALGCPSLKSRIADREEVLKAVAQHLGQDFVAPAWERIRNAKKLVVSTDTAAALIPWDLVRYGDEALVERFEISVVPNLWTAREIQSRLMLGRQPESSRRPLFAFGNAEYQESSESERSCDEGTLSRRTVRSLRLRSKGGESSWSNLDWSHCELTGALRMVGGDSTSLVERRAATEDALRSLSRAGTLKRYKTLLFSAHGRFNTANPLLTGLVFTRSGDDPERDGMFTLNDWSTLDLNSELVVLSGCDTARGDLLLGDGTFGMPTALLASGNANTVASLWPVDDQGTSAFMVAFFRRISHGESASRALWQTKKEFRSHRNPEYRSPATWSAFSLFGI